MLNHCHVILFTTIIVGLVNVEVPPHGSSKNCSFDVPRNRTTRCTCYTFPTSTEIRIIDCSKKTLDEFPMFPLINSVEEIKLNDNNLRVFTDGTRFPVGTRILDISFNVLQAFTETAFEGLTNLQELNLYNNSLMTNVQPRGMFKHLINLRILNIQLNAFRNPNKFTPFCVHSDAFSALKNLRVLKTDAIHFPIFHYGMRKLVHLHTLELSDSTGICDLDHLNVSAFSNLPFLRNISITYCNLQKIHNGTFRNHTYLEELDISYNDELTFNVLPNVTSDLQYLNTSVLKINKLHCTFGKGTELLINHIRNIKQTRLRKLYIDFNRLNLVEYGAASFMPDTLEYFSARLNSFTFGAYILELYKVSHLHDLDISWEHVSSDPTLFESRIFECNDFKETECSAKDREEQKYHDLPKPIYEFYLPKTLKWVNVSRSNLFYTLPMFGFKHSNVETLDISHNILRKWVGPVYGLQNLKSLNMSNNFCESVSLSFFESMTGLKTLRLNSNYLAASFRNDIKGELFSKMQALQELDLSNNQITSLPMNFLKGLKELRHLIVHTNFINRWESKLSHLKNLTYLDLSNNYLTSLDDSLTKDLEEIIITQEGTKLLIKLEGNDFYCSCSTLSKVKWLSKYRGHIEEFENNHCYTDNGTKVIFKNLEDVILALGKECESFVGMIIGVTTLLLCFCCLVISTLIYRFRWRLRYLYYMTRNKLKGYQMQPPQEQILYLYDAFVSYADEDKDFVHYEMLEELETKSGFKLCLSSRDFRPGVPIAANITNAINQSRRTIAVISTNYLRSEWCNYELNMARMESLYTREGDDVLFLIFYHNIPVKNLPRCVIEVALRESFIEYPSWENGRVVFWEKIRETLSS